MWGQLIWDPSPPCRHRWKGRGANQFTYRCPTSWMRDQFTKSDEPQSKPDQGNPVYNWRCDRVANMGPGPIWPTVIMIQNRSPVLGLRTCKQTLQMLAQRDAEWRFRHKWNCWKEKTRDAKVWPQPLTWWFMTCILMLMVMKLILVVTLSVVKLNQVMLIVIKSILVTLNMIKSSLVCDFWLESISTTKAWGLGHLGWTRKTHKTNKYVSSLLFEFRVGCLLKAKVFPAIL